MAGPIRDNSRSSEQAAQAEMDQQPISAAGESIAVEWMGMQWSEEQRGEVTRVDPLCTRLWTVT